MSTSVGDVFMSLRLNDKPFNAELAKTGKAAQSKGNAIGRTLGSGMGKMMATAFAAATVAVGATMIALAKKAATLGDTIDKTSQKLGMSAKTYQEWDYIMQRNGANIESMTTAMKTLASSVATSKDALAELGITQEEAMSMSQEELFARVIKALQGVESTTRRTYLAGQLLGRGATELGALLNLSAQETDALRQRLTMLGGVMSDTAVKNSAAFKDALTDMQMAFHGVYNALAETILPALTGLITKYLIPAIQWLANAIRTLLGVWAGFVGAFSRGMSPIKGAVNKALGRTTEKQTNKTAGAISNVGNAIGGTGSKAKGAKKAVQALKRELLGFDQITKLTKQDASTGTGGAGGVGAGAGGFDMGSIGDLDDYAESANALQNVLDSITIPESLQNALTKLGDAFGKFFGVLKDFGAWVLENVLIPLGKWLAESALPPIIESIAAVIRIISDVLSELGVVLKPLWENILKPIFSWLGETVGEALQLIADLLNWIADWCDKDAERFPKVFEAFGNAIKDAYDRFWEFWKAIDGKVAEVKLELQDKFSNAWETVKKTWETVKSTIGGKVVTAKAALTDGVTSVWAKVQKVWNTAKSTINGKVATAKLALSDAFSSVWNRVKKAWNSIGNKKATITLYFTEKIKSVWNKLADKVNSARNRSAFARTMLPQMPYLAQGGFVKANTPQLAVIGDNKHEGEIVAPESKLRAMAQEAAQGGGNAQMVALLTQILSAIQAQQTNVYLDGKQIADNTVQHINRHTRQTGKLSIIV